MLRQIAAKEVFISEKLKARERRAPERLVRYRVVARKGEGYVEEVLLVKRWVQERALE